MQSVLVVIISLILKFYPSYKILDPILTLIFSSIVIYTTVPLTKKCLTILMQGAPSGLDLTAVKAAIVQDPRIISVSELRVWQLGAGKGVGSVSVLGKKFENGLVTYVKKILKRKGVIHVTVEI